VAGHDEWERLVDELAGELASDLRRHLYRGHLERIRKLTAWSDRFLYLYLLLFQPQSFTSLVRGLNLPRRTAARSLGRLREKGLITLDERGLYWTIEPGNRA